MTQSVTGSIIGVCDHGNDDDGSGTADLLVAWGL
jgi:hypothetical protein